MKLPQLPYLLWLDDLARRESGAVVESQDFTV